MLTTSMKKGAVQGGLIAAGGASMMIGFWATYVNGLPRSAREGGDLAVVFLAGLFVASGSVSGALIAGCSSMFFSSPAQNMRENYDLPLARWARGMERFERGERIAASSCSAAL